MLKYLGVLIGEQHNFNSNVIYFFEKAAKTINEVARFNQNEL